MRTSVILMNLVEENLGGVGVVDGPNLVGKDWFPLSGRSVWKWTLWWTTQELGEAENLERRPIARSRLGLEAMVLAS